MSVDETLQQALLDLDAVVRHIEQWASDMSVCATKLKQRIAALEADNADLRRRIGLPARKDTNADH